jgi:hypothetical protein
LNLRSTVAPDESTRKLLVAFVFVLVFAAGAYEFSPLVLSGDLMGFGYVAVLGVGAVFIVAILNNWRKGVYFFFTWLLFEDLARQWALALKAASGRWLWKWELAGLFSGLL